MSNRNRVTASASMFIVDHETWTSNEHGRADQTRVAIVSPDQPMEVINMRGTAGGEVRVELRLNSASLPNGDVKINGKARLFEGDSEQTTDLDGEEDINLIIPKNGVRSFNTTVRNEDEGDDYATINLNLSNKYIVSDESVSHVRRRVTSSASMFIIDHETWTSNEHGRAHQTGVAIITPDQPMEVIRLKGTAGGEVRVELQLDATSLSNGDVRINGKARLFEGDSTQTNDLDGEEDINVIVPKNGSRSYYTTVRNEDEGDDYATINLNFSNRDI